MLSVKLLLVALLSAVAIDSIAAQFPSACSGADSLSTRRCCPDAGSGRGVCGGSAGHGQCVHITVTPSGRSEEESHKVVRDQWPHYFTQVCECSGNYAGVDCSRCKYGYYGDRCSMKSVNDRRPLSAFDAADWSDYKDILNMTRNHNSGYFVFKQEPARGATSFEDLSKAESVTLYNLFVWVHHYAAKDSEKGIMFVLRSGMTYANKQPLQYLHSNESCTFY